MARGKGKRVHVDMTPECHSVAKQVSAFHNTTLSDLLYYPTRHEFHKEAQCCKQMAAFLEQQGIKIDVNAHKPCYGFRCKTCIHSTACSAGKYEGVVEFDAQLASKFLTPFGKKELTRIQREAGQMPQFAD